jgi:hypothetical protein
MSYELQRPDGEIPAIIIYGQSIAEMDLAQRQALAEKLATHAGASALVDNVDLGQSSTFYETRVRDLTGAEAVRPFTLLISRNLKHSPRHEVAWDYRGVIEAVDSAAPDIIKDGESTKRALGTVVDYGHQLEGPTLFERRILVGDDRNRICAVTFLNPQLIINQSHGMEHMVPRLGPKVTRALGLFLIASTRPRQMGNTTALAPLHR